MTNPLSPETVQWGCTFTPAQVGPGQLYFKLIHAEGPQEWGGRISTFIEVLDMGGQRMVGVPVMWYWADGQVKKPTEPKPGEPFAIDFPMNAKGNSYGVRIVNGDIPSDSIFGFGLADQGPHQVFKVVFQLAVAGGVSEPPTPTEPPAMTAAEAIERAQNYFAQGLQLLAYALEFLA